MNGVIKFLFGKDVAIAIKLIRVALMLLESIQEGRNPNIAPFAREVFQFVPARLKDPIGPATEQEFIDAVFNVFSLFVKPKS